MINEEMRNSVDALVNNNTPIFYTKEEYLKWRAEWKENYKKISLIIRKLKNDRKTKYGDDNLTLTKEDKKFIEDHITKSSWWQLEAAQAKVRTLICELYAAREIQKKRK